MKAREASSLGAATSPQVACGLKDHARIALHAAEDGVQIYHDRECGDPSGCRQILCLPKSQAVGLSFRSTGFGPKTIVLEKATPESGMSLTHTHTQKINAPLRPVLP